LKGNTKPEAAAGHRRVRNQHSTKLGSRFRFLQIMERPLRVRS
jgi:hypothetical protein